MTGSCTNGRIEDLRLGARVPAGYKTRRDVRLIVISGTRALYRQAMDEGLITVFLDAGVVLIRHGRVAAATCSLPLRRRGTQKWLKAVTGTILFGRGVKPAVVK